MNKCLVCRHNSYIPVYNNTLKKCTHCGFITVNHNYNKKELQEIYSENYFKGEEYLDYVAEKDSLQKNFRNRLQYILKHSSPYPIKSVLEIGCAYGFFARTITTMLPDVEYLGIDVVHEAVEYGRKKMNQNLIVADYMHFNPEKKFTDIFMWDVIEHLQNPDDFLKKAYNELKKNGNIYITTGDINRFIPKIRKEKWRLIHPPSHLHYFSATSLSKLLNNTGFKVEFIRYPAIYRSLKQMYYSLFLLNKKHSKIKMFGYKLIPQKAKIPLNTFDIMFVKAKKI